MDLAWTGPFQIRELLERCLDQDQPWPPAAEGVYLVSRKQWTDNPTVVCGPLYVGGTTGKSNRFCTRVGDLVADMHGFWDGGTGHHSGGQKLYLWCEEHRINPGDLYIGWATAAEWCDRCAEIVAAKALIEPGVPWERSELLNKNRPPRCEVHDQAVP